MGRAGQVFHRQGVDQGSRESGTRQRRPGRSERRTDGPDPEQVGRVLPKSESPTQKRRPGQR